MPHYLHLVYKFTEDFTTIIDDRIKMSNIPKQSSAKWLSKRFVFPLIFVDSLICCNLLCKENYQKIYPFFYYSQEKNEEEKRSSFRPSKSPYLILQHKEMCNLQNIFITKITIKLENVDKQPIYILHAKSSQVNINKFISAVLAILYCVSIFLYTVKSNIHPIYNPTFIINIS